MVSNNILSVHKKRNMNAYNKSMNKSIEEKYLQITSRINFKNHTTIVDFGTGTGILAFNIAKLNPNVNVIGSDISPNYIKKAKLKYKLDNLDFIVVSSSEKSYNFTFKGTPIKPDYVIFSSVLHEVYSYQKIKKSINPLDDHIQRMNAVGDCLRKTLQSLSNNGKIIIRDFCGPVMNRYVCFQTYESLPKKYSLEKFCKNSKFSLYPLVYHKLCKNKYLLNERTLYEYIYHKDWRECWEQEFEERYSFWNKDIALEIVKSAGYKKPVYDLLSGEWIKRHRMFNKIKTSNYFYNEKEALNQKCINNIYHDYSLPNYQILLVASK